MAAATGESSAHLTYNAPITWPSPPSSPRARCLKKEEEDEADRGSREGEVGAPGRFGVSYFILSFFLYLLDCCSYPRPAAIIIIIIRRSRRPSPGASARRLGCSRRGACPAWR